MKSYTDIEQSKKLAEFLPVESADMFWYRDAVVKENRPRIMSFSQVPKIQSMYYSPCWSLAALMHLLPSVITRKEKRMFLTLEKAGAYNLYYKSPNRLDELWETKEELIDACVTLIEDLHELNLL